MVTPKVELKKIKFSYSREWGENGSFEADVCQ